MPERTRTDPTRVAVALDLSGLRPGPAGTSGVVADAIAALLRAEPGVDLVLVGPEPDAGPADRAAAAAAAGDRLGHVRSGAAADPADPDRAVRSRLDVPTRVGAARVAAGAVDVLVSAATPAVALAAARVALPALPGAGRPVLVAAVAVPGSPRPAVVGDVGGEVHPDVDTVAAVVGAAARSLAGPDARVRPLLGEGPHPVGARALLDGAVDGLVADGRSGAVLLDALTAAAAVHVLGLVVLGRSGPVVVAEPSVEQLCAAVGLAARLVRGGVVDACTTELAAVVRARRVAAGLPSVPGGPR